jgi:serine/threonine protein kinase
MAPELLEHGITSKAADVYSFGVLLWQMLASSRWVLS